MMNCLPEVSEQAGGWRTPLSKTGTAEDAPRRRFRAAELRGLFELEYRRASARRYEGEFRSKDVAEVWSRFCEPGVSAHRPAAEPLLCLLLRLTSSQYGFIHQANFRSKAKAPPQSLPVRVSHSSQPKLTGSKGDASSETPPAMGTPSSESWFAISGINHSPAVIRGRPRQN